jgi:hypothetical protein
MRSGTKETSERNYKLEFVNNFIERAGMICGSSQDSLPRNLKQYHQVGKQH